MCKGLLRALALRQQYMNRSAQRCVLRTESSLPFVGALAQVLAAFSAHVTSPSPCVWSMIP